MPIDLSYLPESERQKLMAQAKRDQVNAELGGDAFPLDHFIQDLKNRGYTSPERGVPAGRFSSSHPVAQHHTKDGNITFYNPVKKATETRPSRELEGVPLRIGSNVGKPEGYTPGLEMTGFGYGGGYGPEYAQRYLDRHDQYNQMVSDREAANKRSQQEAARRAEEARVRREAEIRQRKVDDLNKRIEFEKTNPLIERRQSASGRYFDAVSPGQSYVVPEGGDILEGKFERLPFISRSEYDKSQGSSGGRVLGRGRVGSQSRGILGDEEETLGKKTLLGT